MSNPNPICRKNASAMEIATLHKHLVEARRAIDLLTGLSNAGIRFRTNLQEELFREMSKLENPFFAAVREYELAEKCHAPFAHIQNPNVWLDYLAKMEKKHG